MNANKEKAYPKASRKDSGRLSAREPLEERDTGEEKVLAAQDVHKRLVRQRRRHRTHAGGRGRKVALGQHGIGASIGFRSVLVLRPSKQGLKPALEIRLKALEQGSLFPRFFIGRAPPEDAMCTQVLDSRIHFTDVRRHGALPGFRFTRKVEVVTVSRSRRN